MENYYNYIASLYESNKILCIDIDGKVYDVHNIEKLSLLMSAPCDESNKKATPLIFDSRDYKTLSEFMQAIYSNTVLCMEYIDHNEDKYNNDRVNTRYDSMYCIYNDIKEYV